MIRTGLLSVTFRQLTNLEIIQLVKETGLDAIEWGGDIHVPHGNIHTARETAKMTADAGLATASYGSYYRAGVSEGSGLSFESVRDTAAALGTPAIRVWAGDRGSVETDEKGWHDVLSDLARIGELAAQAGLEIHLEYHSNTLTDSRASVNRMLSTLEHPAVRFNWQPPTDWSQQDRLSGLTDILPLLASLHVFHWKPGVRLPLLKGAEEWKSYLDLAATTGRSHYAMLEFVKADDPEQFRVDAQTLLRLVQPLTG
ncbi:sugar phosphate isomerase/epimerase family protein [Paenibacillus daejeonensis]|uniref:sugar phosphate isomerase/epimerase family protein n=1 Tax=Paenibacillus daejeonensis TaxID=135193 RepID=UPI0003642E3B|nr:TIM barrel protein [Paenibacillus daejeonensis]